MNRALATLAALGLAALIGAGASPAAPEVDRPKLPPEPDGFRLGGDPERGAKVFQKSCALCHGPRGKGDGRIKSDPPPRDLTDAAALKTASDWELYQVILNGGQILGLAPKMLPWKDILEDQEARDVASYVKSLSAPAE
jgi:mono/diheme cytochrome c family protein